LNTRSGGASGGVFDEAGRKRISEAAKQSYRSTNRALRSMGESSAVSRLTEPEVREMRDAYASGRESQRGLARRFGVHRNTVWKIVARHYWPHI
jgi:DNA invertase Pin-like site-specific DNA recombinase